MRYHHRELGYGDLFDFPCSRTFRDYFADPYGPVCRDREDNDDQDDRLRRLIRDELAARDARRQAQRDRDRVLFGPQINRDQRGEPPEMPPPEEIMKAPAQKPQVPGTDKPYKGVSLD